MVKISFCLSILVKFSSQPKQICLFLAIFQKEECKADIIIEKGRVEKVSLENIGLNKV